MYGLFNNLQLVRNYKKKKIKYVESGYDAVKNMLVWFSILMHSMYKYNIAAHPGYSKTNLVMMDI